MKTFKNLVLLSLFVLVILPTGLMAKCESASGEIIDIIAEFKEQFDEFVRINKELKANGKTDKTNYFFVYTPGEPFDFYKPIPLSFMAPPDNNWLRDEDNIMPLVEKYRDHLRKWNDKEITISNENRKAQHLVVILNFSSYYEQSSIWTLHNQQVINLPVAFTNLPVQDGILLNISNRSNELNYTNSTEYRLANEINSIVAENVNNNLFDDNYINAVTIAGIYPNLTLLGQAVFDPTSANAPHVEIRSDIRQLLAMDSDSLTIWLDTIAIIQDRNNPPGYPKVYGQVIKSQGFQRVVDLINAFIRWTHKTSETGMSGMSCDEYQTQLWTDEARLFYNNGCTTYNEFVNQPQLKELYQISAGFFDYVQYLNEQSLAAPGNIDLNDADFDGLALGTDFWEAFIEDVINDFVNENSQDLALWLRDYYNEEGGLTQAQKETFSIQQFFYSFYNFKQPSYAQNLLDAKGAFNYFFNKPGLDWQDVEDVVHDYFPYIRAVNTNNARLALGNAVKEMANGNYDLETEVIPFFQSLEGNTIHIWENVIVYNYEGLPEFIGGFNTREFLDNLLKLTFKAKERPSVNELLNKVLINQVQGVEWNDPILENDPYPHTWKKYFTNENYETVVYDFDESNVKHFNITEKFHGLSVQFNGQPKTPLVLHDYECKLEDISFFDYFTPIRADYPIGASDCCFEQGTPCNFNGAVMPAFYYAGLNAIEEGEEEIQTAISVVDAATFLLTVTQIYKGVKLMLTAASGSRIIPAKLILTTSLNVLLGTGDVLLYINPEGVSDAFTDLFGSSAIGQNLLFIGNLYIAFNDPDLAIQKLNEITQEGANLDNLLNNNLKSIDIAAGNKLLLDAKTAIGEGVTYQQFSSLDNVNTYYTSQFADLLERSKIEALKRDVQFNYNVKLRLKEVCGFNSIATVETLFSSKRLGPFYVAARANGFNDITDIINTLGDNGRLTKFAEDLDNSTNGNSLFLLFANSSDGAQFTRRINSWNHLYSSPQRRKDINLLLKMDEVLADQTILSRLGGEEGLVDIVKKNSWAPCCGNTHPWLKSIDNYLDDVKNFADEFGSPPPSTGYDVVLGAMKTNNIWMVESVAQMLKKISSQPSVFTKANVQSFDNTFASVVDEGADLSCLNCKFDLALNDGNKYEFKSYATNTVNNIPNNANFKNQCRAYLETGVVSKVHYIFETGKISGDIVNVRNQFLTMLKNDPDYFWTGGSSAFWQSIDPSITNADQLEIFLDNSTSGSSWLSFIVAE